MKPFVVSAFYKFIPLDDFEELQEPLQALCREHAVRGTILLAAEGINGTIAGSRIAVDALNERLRSHDSLADLITKESFCDSNPFYRMKVRLKQEIVTMKIDGSDPTDAVGQYVKPADWNALISDPDVVLIDTRNDFEVEIGTFKGAVDPKTISFSDFPEFVDKNLDAKRDKKVAMFCTGGIRCEKATNYLVNKGFENVYHLQGGILKYFEDVDEKDSLWEGECFIFDGRVTLDQNLEPGHYLMCRACGQPFPAEACASEKYEEGVSCPHCFGTLTARHLERAKARQAQMVMARASNRQHIGERSVVRSKP